MTQDLNQEYDKIYLHQLQSTSYLLVIGEIISLIVLFIELFIKKQENIIHSNRGLILSFLSPIHDRILSLSEVVK